MVVGGVFCFGLLSRTFAKPWTGCAPESLGPTRLWCFLWRNANAGNGANFRASVDVQLCRLFQRWQVVVEQVRRTL
ncbi:uncharacterized protein K452DRAFT_129498, partial [Aplosporella prunicola CBS 121167]